MILVGIFIRILFLDSHTLWYDETVALAIAHAPLDEIFSLTTSYNWGFVYVLILKFLSLVTQDHLLLRISSVIFSTLSVWMTYQFFVLWDKRIALFTTLFLILSPLSIYFSVELREYALVALEIITLVYLFEKYSRTRAQKYALWYGAVSIFTLHTHFYAGLMLLTLFVLGLWKNKLGKIWISINLLIGISFLPWLILLTQIKRPSCWCMDPITGLLALFYSFTTGGMGSVTFYDVLYKANTFIVLYFCGVALYFLSLFIMGMYKILKSNYKIWLYIFFTPIIFALLIGTRFPIFSPRSLMYLSPWYFAIISYFINSISDKSLQKSILTFSCLLLFGVLLVQFVDPFFRFPFSD